MTESIPPLSSTRWLTPPEPPAHLAGKGLFVRHIWEVEGDDGAAMARWARRLGARFLVVKCTHAGGPYRLSAERDPTPAMVRTLSDQGLTVWGWAGLIGESPEGEAKALLDRAAELNLRGWVLEPSSRYPAAAMQALVGALRANPTRLELGLLGGRGLGEARWAAFSALVDVLLPRGSSMSEIEATIDVLALPPRTVIPVLDLEAELLTAGADSIPHDGPAVRELLAGAKRCGYPAAAVLTWEACIHTPSGRDTLRALVDSPWTVERSTGP